MNKEQVILISPFKGLLQLEAIRLMKEGWGIKMPIKSVWSWTKFHYVFKIVMVKNGGATQIDEMYADLNQHLDDLAAYNRANTAGYGLS